MKHMRGVTLIEMVMAVSMLAAGVFMALGPFTEGLRTYMYQREQLAYMNAAKGLRAYVQTLGYFDQGFNTAVPLSANNALDPAVLWANLLRQYYGVNLRGQIDVEFYKDSGGTLVPFTDTNGNDFDDVNSNQERSALMVHCSAHGYSDHAVTVDVFISASASTTLLRSILAYLRTQLDRAASDPNFGAYPSTAQGLAQLVTLGYLQEIPNNPYTAAGVKVTHTEDAVDYEYTNDTVSRQITLRPYSHYSSVYEQWSY